jgi:hypothetical protein
MITLTNEQVKALVAWAKAKTTGCGPQFNAAFDVAVDVAKRDLSSKLKKESTTIPLERFRDELRRLAVCFGIDPNYSPEEISSKIVWYQSEKQKEYNCQLDNEWQHNVETFVRRMMEYLTPFGYVRPAEWDRLVDSAAFVLKLEKDDE